MNSIRAQINLAINDLDGTAFQHLASQCLRPRWPSLISTAAQADLGEDAITLIDETSDGVVRSLACSLTATWGKLSDDARKIVAQRSDVQELIFATPKTVTRKTQNKWESKIKKQYGWDLIVIERSEFLAILEHPESQWICRQYLNLSLGYFHLLKTAEALRDTGAIGHAMEKAQDLECGALDAGDWGTVCRAQILMAELHAEMGGICESYRDKALEALSTAQEHRLTSMLTECLSHRANSILVEKPQEARNLLEEAESVVGENSKIKCRICLIRAELELDQGHLEKSEESLLEWESLAGKNRNIDHQSFYFIMFRLATIQSNHSGALKYLNKTLKYAKSKKRRVSVGRILHEKARYLAQQKEFRKAAKEAEKARVAFEKASLKKEAFESALLAGHLFFECHSSERALALADYVIHRADSEQYDNVLQVAYQLKTRSLQVLKRTEDAREWNQRFREHMAYQPQALVVADIQDAMLRAQERNFADAESIMEMGMKRARETMVPPKIISAIKVHWAQIKMDQAKYREARVLAEDALDSALDLPQKLREEATHIIKIAEERQPITSIYEKILSSPTPLSIAGTDKSSSIQVAHQEIIRPLLDWTMKWPKAIQEIYDFWGRGNFARLLLNHRGFPDAFHVTVEVTSMDEARQWTQILSPLVDVLTILWKGPLLTGGMALVPVRRDYDDPGGWGIVFETP